VGLTTRSSEPVILSPCSPEIPFMNEPQKRARRHPKYKTHYRVRNEEDHDIVYTLDLRGQPLRRLYGEDLAKFRNLNHLILRNTPITSVPDEVVGLPNLRTIDLTGTPNAEAESQRLTRLTDGRVSVIK
jgi:hypothetical protein